MRPRVLLVASEAIPLIKTGGLADVVTAMAQSLHLRGIDLTLLMPAYPSARAALVGTATIAELTGLPCGEAHLLQGKVSANGFQIVLLDCAGFRRRIGNPYVDGDGREYEDNALCFASLAHAAVRICAGATPLPVPHVVHANDWHAALIPALLRAADIRDVGTVLTIHNLAFQGNCPLELAPALGLPASMTGPDGAEFWGRLSFLKAGIRYADRISIVSRSYAQEVLTPRFGCGLEGILNERHAALVPIANGVDTEIWNPATDPFIARRFSAADLRNKAHCKRALLRLFGLPERPYTGRPAPLLAIGSRITHQKMADVVLAALPRLLASRPQLQVVVLGCGERDHEAGFQDLAARFPERVGVHIGYDEARAHALHAGADMLLHGTRFEPFGLTPIYAMRYGTVPIASRVGGIIDTVVDAPAAGASGVLFEGEEAGDMVNAVERALALYAQADAWRTMQRNAMGGDFSWERPAQAYIDLYREIAPPDARLLFASKPAPEGEPEADPEERPEAPLLILEPVLPAMAEAAA